eukprot:7352952-Prymnesium_polylepis.1
MRAGLGSEAVGRAGAVVDRAYSPHVSARPPLRARFCGRVRRAPSLETRRWQRVRRGRRRAK